jgi:conjugative transposon protein
VKKTLSDIPFSIIEKAINEDIEAIDYILAHYRNYIIRLSTRVARDENNNEYMYVDDDMRSRLESKLIYSIIKKFKILS